MFLGKSTKCNIVDSPSMLLRWSNYPSNLVLAFGILLTPIYADPYNAFPCSWVSDFSAILMCWRWLVALYMNIGWVLWPELIWQKARVKVCTKSLLQIILPQRGRMAFIYISCRSALRHPLKALKACLSSK